MSEGLPPLVVEVAVVQVWVVPAWVVEVEVVVEQVAQVVPLEVEVVGKLRPLWPVGGLPQTV